MVEVWKSIPGFSRYEASNFGRVRRNILVVIGRGRRAHAEIALHQTFAPPYFRVSVVDDLGRWRCSRVHVLVALAFCGPKPSPRHNALHEDDDSINNSSYNIRWGTKRDNALDAIRNGRASLGSSRSNAVLSVKSVTNIRGRVKEGESFYRLAKEYGCSSATIRSAAIGKSWKYLPGACKIRRGK
jgi:hypothetical protein